MELEKKERNKLLKNKDMASVNFIKKNIVQLNTYKVITVTHKVTHTITHSHPQSTQHTHSCTQSHKQPHIKPHSPSTTQKHKQSHTPSKHSEKHSYMLLGCANPPMGLNFISASI